QRRGTQGIGTIGERRLRKVERGNELVEEPVGFGGAAIGERIRRNYIDRHATVGNRAVGTARARHDDQRVCIFLGCASVLRGGGSRPAGRSHRRRKGEEGEGIRSSHVKLPVIARNAVDQNSAPAPAIATLFRRAIGQLLYC